MKEATWTRTPVTVRGVAYPGITQAIEALWAAGHGTPRDCKLIGRRLRDGWTPEQAFGLEPRRKTSARSKPVTIFGQTYPSLAAAARAHLCEDRLALLYQRVAVGKQVASRALDDLARHWPHRKELTDQERAALLASYNSESELQDSQLN